VPLTAVAFDLMDTVVRDPFRDALTAGTGRSLAEVLRRKDAEGWPRFERGELTEAEYFQTYGDLEVDVAAFHHARRAGYRWLPGMRELLEDLAGEVVRATASNYPVWVEELADGLLAGCFDAVIASHHLGVRKPDPAFYARLCAKLEADPERVLLVDDRPANVEGALAAGLRAHRFADAEDLRARLRSEGVGV
jgi:HAD superfamily hydrolase (TIGR01509 family)